MEFVWGKGRRCFFTKARKKQGEGCLIVENAADCKRCGNGGTLLSLTPCAAAYSKRGLRPAILRIASLGPPAADAYIHSLLSTFHILKDTEPFYEKMLRKTDNYKKTISCRNSKNRAAVLLFLHKISMGSRCYR